MLEMYRSCVNYLGVKKNKKIKKENDPLLCVTYCALAHPFSGLGNDGEKYCGQWRIDFDLGFNMEIASFESCVL